MTTQEQSIPWSGMENGTIINDTSLPTDQILTAMSNDPNFRSISGWINQTQNPSGSMFERDRYHVPNDIHKQFKHGTQTNRRISFIRRFSQPVSPNII